MSREVFSCPVNPEFGESCVGEAFLSLSSASLTPSCHCFSGHLTLDRPSLGQLEKALEMTQMCSHAHPGAELRTGSEAGVNKRRIRESRKPCVLGDEQQWALSAGDICGCQGFLLRVLTWDIGLSS